MRLPLPVRDATRGGGDPEHDFGDASIERMWRGIAARRAPKSRAPARAFLFAAAALAIVLVVFVGRGRFGAIDHGGPLQLRDGAAVVALTAIEESREFALSDGSHVDLAQGATFATRQNSGSAFEGTLRGKGTFDVRPGGPRKWAIDCGAATVEVVGTRFVIDARVDRVRVEVERGRVRVSSAKGAKELGAGEWIEVEAPTANANATATPSPGSLSASRPEPGVPPTATATATATPRAATWQDLAKKGDYSAAYDTLGAPGIARVTPRATVEELLALADVARLSGHPADAVAPLTRVYAENPGDSRAGMAAFTLGRIDLDALGQPAGAADAFKRALDLGVPASLREDAFARLVEARAKAGDRAGAESAFAAYTRAFPQGGRSTTMRRWIDGDNDGRRAAPSPSP